MTTKNEPELLTRETFLSRVRDAVDMASDALVGGRVQLGDVAGHDDEVQNKPATVQRIGVSEDGDVFLSVDVDGYQDNPVTVYLDELT